MIHKHDTTIYDRRQYVAMCTCGEPYTGKTPEEAESRLLAEHVNIERPLTFTLSITLGGEEMQTGSDVAGVLRDLLTEPSLGGLESGRMGRLFDTNGNTVGSWAVQ